MLERVVNSIEANPKLDKEDKAKWHVVPNVPKPFQKEKLPCLSYTIFMIVLEGKRGKKTKVKVNLPSAATGNASDGGAMMPMTLHPFPRSLKEKEIYNSFSKRTKRQRENK